MQTGNGARPKDREWSRDGVLGRKHWMWPEHVGECAGVARKELDLTILCNGMIETRLWFGKP